MPHPDKSDQWIDKALDIVLCLAALCAVELLIAHFGEIYGWWTLG